MSVGAHDPIYLYILMYWGLINVDDKTNQTEVVEEQSTEVMSMKYLPKQVRIISIITFILLGAAFACIVGSLFILNRCLGYKEEIDGYVSQIYDNEHISDMIYTISQIDKLYESKDINKSDVDVSEALGIALSAYVYALGDEYGSYIPPEFTSEYDIKMTEQLSGIGVTTRIEENGEYISRVYKGLPADKAGIKVGDIIIKADGVNYADVGNDEFTDLIRGKAGTDVVITVLRDGEELDFRITREVIIASSVNYDFIEDNTICYISIDQFSDKTDEELIKALEAAKSAGVSDIIVDLRDNSGGRLTTTVNILDYILPEGLILRVDGSNDELKKAEYYSDASCYDANFVVIVNSGTASASELFTQSLRDYGLATVVGTRTYGKGTVLTQYKLDNGGYLSLSTAMYYTASGTCVEDVGIEPDYRVELSDPLYYKLTIDEDEQIQKAIEILQDKESDNS